MSAVLVTVLATSLALTYRVVARAARAAAAVRLEQVARLLATSADQSTRQRVTLAMRVAHDTAVVHALREADAGAAPPPATIAAATGALGRLALPTDSGLPIALFAADGRRVAAVGERIEPRERAESPGHPALGLPASAARLGDSLHTDTAYVAAGRVYFQTVLPVDMDGARLGYLVQLRRLANNQNVGTQLRELTGEAVAVYLHQRGSRLWASLTGQPTTAPTALEHGFVGRGADGPRLTTSVPLGSGPWIVTLEEPLAAVLAQPRALLRDLALLSLLLTVVGAGAAWAIGRRIARPLASLTEAAEAIARGDYRSRVTTDGHDEIGRLARSFNAMAAEVDAAHGALARQYAEARTVADELEAANRQLHTAMRAVEEARDAAEHANRAKSDFLAVMSHELRTPLNAISGYTELIQLGIYGPVSAEQSHALTRIRRSQSHLLGLIDDVLTFAKLNASKLQFSITDVPLADALAGVEPMIAPQMAAKSLRYTCTLASGALAARADREKLQQIVLNLLSNAVKFTPAGGSVGVECTEAGDVVHVVVRDTGIGIPPDRLAHVFEPFVQVDRALNRPHEGVGLGLAISHDLAIGMGGTLLAESAVGRGSTFTVVLPRATAPVDSRSGRAALASGTASSAAGRS